MKKFSISFERDYNFYFENRKHFTFSGINTKEEYKIQFKNESGTFLIGYSSEGKTAKECFYKLDSEGKRLKCSEPELLVEILNCKAAVNLQIKMWAQGRAEYTLSLEEIKEYAESYNSPTWVLIAVENLKTKIIKQYVKEHKHNQNFYRDALEHNMFETINEINNLKEIIPDKIIIINEPKVKRDPVGSIIEHLKTKPMPVWDPNSNIEKLKKKIPTTLSMEAISRDTIPMDVSCMTLYRPIGGLEYHLIKQSDFSKFPSKLQQNIIFYPGISEEYAIQIARDLTNDIDNGNIGLVAKFRVRLAFISMYSVHMAGNYNREYAIPSEHLDKFNSNIVGNIEITHVFKGDKKK